MAEQNNLLSKRTEIVSKCLHSNKHKLRNLKASSAIYDALQSVAKLGGRGGSSLPQWPEKYANKRVFSTFEADFWSKNENSLPKGNWGETR